jgi:hypothetical protein
MLMGQADLKARMQTLEDIESIRRLKSKYWRCLDRKLWRELSECFARGATADYGPRLQFKGRKAIVDFLKQSLDYFILQPSTRRRGWGFYDDEYVKEDGRWKKKSTKMTTVLEEWEPPRKQKPQERAAKRG